MTFLAVVAGLYAVALNQGNRAYLPEGSRVVRTATLTYECFNGPGADRVWAGMKPQLSARGGRVAPVARKNMFPNVEGDAVLMPDGTRVAFMRFSIDFGRGAKFKAGPDGMVLTQRPVEPPYAFLKRIWPF